MRRAVLLVLLPLGATAAPADPFLDAVAAQIASPALRHAAIAQLRSGSPCEALRKGGTAREALVEAGWSELLHDDFDGYGEADWSAQGEVHGGGPDLRSAPWHTRWTGCEGPCADGTGVAVEPARQRDGTLGGVLRQRPALPEWEDVDGDGHEFTRSSLVVSAEDDYRDFFLEVDRRTVEQLRPEGPNNWEAAWILWRYGAQNRPQDALNDPPGYCGHQRGYYLVLKPGAWGGDHWEFGKLGPGYAVPAEGSGDCQRFVATGFGPRDPLGDWQRVCIGAVGEHMAFWVDGQRLDFGGQTSFAESEDRGPRWISCPPDVDADPRCEWPRVGEIPGGEPPYTSGAIGLYNEDAAVGFDRVLLFGRRGQSGGLGAVPLAIPKSTDAELERLEDLGVDTGRVTPEELERQGAERGGPPDHPTASTVPGP